MKKLYAHIFLFLLIMINFSLANAQLKPGLGIKTGLNLSTQTSTGVGENVNVDNILRFHGGIYFNLFLLNKIAIQPEVIISGKGSYWNDPYYDTRDLLTYIDLPVLIRYQPLKIVNIHAGPQFGYLISALQHDIESSEKTEIKEYYNNADFGIVFGVEANLPFRLNITLRYILGLSTVTAEDGDYIDPWKNNVLQLSAGLRIFGD